MLMMAMLMLMMLMLMMAMLMEVMVLVMVMVVAMAIPKHLLDIARFGCACLFMRFVCRRAQDNTIFVALLGCTLPIGRSWQRQQTLLCSFHMFLDLVQLQWPASASY